MAELKERKCVACEGDVPPLTDAVVERYLTQVDNWAHNGNSIEKTFVLKDFKEALSLVNKVGSLAEEEGHHPDITIYSWNKVLITLTTHAINGLSDNDFIMAAKIDGLFP